MLPVISEDFRQRYKNVSVRLLDSVSLTSSSIIEIIYTYKQSGVATDVYCTRVLRNPNASVTIG